MKVYQLEFDYFCGVAWETETVNIIANSRRQMKEAFLEATQFIASSRNLTKWEEQEELWNKVEQHIQVKTLDFPIINSKFL